MAVSTVALACRPGSVDNGRMGCLLGCAALFFPRVVLILIWMFTDYLDGVWSTLLWPIVGFFLMPLTTIAYAFAIHQGNGTVGGIGLAAIIVAAVFDASSWGGGWRSTRTRKIVVKRN